MIDHFTAKKTSQCKGEWNERKKPWKISRPHTACTKLIMQIITNWIDSKYFNQLRMVVDADALYCLHVYLSGFPSMLKLDTIPNISHFFLSFVYTPLKFIYSTFY